MIALNILNLRKFMSAFLIQDLFDNYTLIEAQITTFCTHSIDGRLEKSFFESRNAVSASPESSGTSPSAAPAHSSPVTAVQDPGRPAAVEYVRWKMVRAYCYSIIRGKLPPLFFKFIFFYPPEELGAFLRAHGLDPEGASVSGLCLNLRYDGQALVLTTGTSMKVFTMDRSVDEAWDAAVRDMLTKSGIEYEKI